MIVVFIRTVLVYLMVTGAMRLMGKRQIGQLEVSELVTTLLLSEIATLPIENPDIPLLYAVIPVVTLLTLEVSMAVLLSRCPRLRRKIEAPPCMLICRGEWRQEELARNRLSVEEVLSGLRQQGVQDPDEADYAILEKNGRLSVILKEEHRPLTARDTGLNPPKEGMMHVLMSDGAVNQYNLCLLGKDEAWLKEILRQKKARPDDVLYLLCNDAGEIRMLRKEGKT
jgi:uncharacterized membrane protein YcaP (DUF421 family)